MGPTQGFLDTDGRFTSCALIGRDGTRPVLGPRGASRTESALSCPGAHRVGEPAAASGASATGAGRTGGTRGEPLPATYVVLLAKMALQAA